MRTIKNTWVIIILILLSHISIAQNMTSDTTLANNYFEKATEFYKTKNYDSAIVYFEKASTIYQERELWRKYLQSETKHSESYQRKWKLDKAIMLIKSAIETALLKVEEKDTIVADAYYIIGLSYVYQNNYDPAIFYWEKSLEVNKKLFGEEDASIASAFNNIGLIYTFKDEYDLALQYQLKALNIRKRLFGEKHSLIANSYNNIGIVYKRKNELDLSLEFHSKALQIRKELFGEKNRDVAGSYQNIGLIYFNKKQYDLSIEYNLRSLEIQKELLGEKHPHVASIYNNLGNGYNFKGEYDNALKSYLKALQIREELFGGKHNLVAESYNNIGTVYLSKREYDLALDYHFKALQIRGELLGNKHTELARSYKNIGNIFEEKKEYSLALDYYQKAIVSNMKTFNDTININAVPIIRNYINWLGLLNVLLAKAQILANHNEDLTGLENQSGLELALCHYQACDTLINLARQDIVTKSDKIALGERATNVYEGAIDVCYKLMEQGNDKKVEYYKNLAFYFSEKNKSSVLLEALAGSEAQKFAGIPDTLLQKEHNLQIDMALYKRLLAEQPDTAREIMFNDKLFKANREYDALIKTFENEFPEYFELKYNQKPAMAKDIQEILDNKTAMISYFSGDSTISIFTITKDNLDFKMIPINENLADIINEYRYGLIYTNSTRFAEEYKIHAYNLYKRLLPENINQQIENLIIIPDAELSMIPFETMLTETTENEEWKELPYLIKRYNISYSYSANLFYKTFPKASATEIETTELNDWLAFAPVFDDSETAGLTLRTRELLRSFDSAMNDTLETRGRLVDGGYISSLPGTESEVKSIFKEFEGKDKKALVQIKKNANEDFIKEGGLQNYRYIHFATHGFVNTEKPELSGIFLAQDSTLNEDGILYQGEIYNLDLNADLTVLSACETGLGQIKKGEGLIGLTRALLYAGSKNIIVSLWKVADESTSELMINFYKNFLEENKTKVEFSEALRQSKIAMIEEGEFAHPFYWSPFILIGK